MLYGRVLAAALALGAAAPALAAEVEVKMLDRGAAGMMVFEPALVKIAPGDTVRFVPTAKGHNVETIAGMLPDDAEPIAGKINQEVVVSFGQAGVYGIKCKPHYGMGMVGLIVVGDAGNLEQAAAVKHPGKANKVFAKLFQDAGGVDTAAR
jgi:pseudoazurin